MGLSISVGMFASLTPEDEEFIADVNGQLEIINKVLQAAGLPRHNEPFLMDEICSLEMYGYSGLHYLRRIAVHLWKNGKVPEPGDEDSMDDPLIAEYDEANLEIDYASAGKALRFDHLLWHSDCEGYYVPVAFNDVLFGDTDQFGKLHGDMLGSSQMLMKECELIAKHLGLPLSEIDEEDEELWLGAETQGEGDGWKRYGVESFTCKRLHKACEESIKHKRILTFC